MLAIIPARAGSKGLPRKNILPLQGKPMIAYAIEAACRAVKIDRVIVTTEDEEIAKISRCHGAEVPFMRPVELATDTAPNGLACLHVIDQLATLESKPRESFVLIQPTSPLLDSGLLDEAVALFCERQPSAVVAARPMERTVESVFLVDNTQRIKNVLKHTYGIKPRTEPRQLLGQRYCFSGACFVLRVDRMREDVDYFYWDNDVCAVFEPEGRGLDVDNIVDFKLADLLLAEKLVEDQKE